VPRPPRVSVGMPVRNGGAHLQAALTSLLAQTYEDFELVVSDNASDDGVTEEVCRAAAREDDRVRYVRQERNLGANANYNAVVAAARGELFRWAAADDLVLPEFLAEVVSLLDSRADAVLAHTAAVLIDDDGEPLRRDGDRFVTRHGVSYHAPDEVGSARRLADPRPSVRYRDVLLHSRWCFEMFGVVRREVLLTTALHRPFYGTDKVLLAELALRGAVLHSERPLFLRRCHDGASTRLGIWEKVRWSNPTAKLPVPPVAHMAASYLRAPLQTPLPAGERARALAAVAAKAAQRDKLRNLVVPGPENYLGLTRR
jgi:glycosyltransferase involved in cell wall biosynthesis